MLTKKPRDLAPLVLEVPTEDEKLMLEIREDRKTVVCWVNGRVRFTGHSQQSSPGARSFVESGPPCFLHSPPTRRAHFHVSVPVCTCRAAISPHFSKVRRHTTTGYRVSIVIEFREASKCHLPGTVLIRRPDSPSRPSRHPPGWPYPLPCVRPVMKPCPLESETHILRKPSMTGLRFHNIVYT